MILTKRYCRGAILREEIIRRSVISGPVGGYEKERSEQLVNDLNATAFDNKVEMRARRIDRQLAVKSLSNDCF